MTGFFTRLHGIGFAAVVVLTQPSCRPQSLGDNPNRVLDRPTDLVLTCARIYCEDEDGDDIVDDEECRAQAGSLDQCVVSTSSACDSRPVYDDLGIGRGDYQLFGFIANSERNEVAMFAQCADRLVDLNVGTPGYNFVPTGILPTHLDATADGCRVLSSNAGSCDLSVLGAEGLAGYGFELGATIEEPSALVDTLVPTRYDAAIDTWVPLGARPAELIVVPSSLSSAPDNQGTLSGDQCDPSENGSVYVSFPTCNLVAEIDLITGHVLQSRQFVSNDEGGIDVVDTGLEPICPVECPGQFEGELPDDLPEIDQDGPFPQALELLRPIPTSEDASRVDAADEALDNQALFVGGLGSDFVFELRMTESGQWTDDVQSLELQGASGVTRIRVSPPVDFQDSSTSTSIEFPATPDQQFLYVIVGDGSTRVISRALEIDPGDPLGSECDTQRDPVGLEGAAEWACYPVSDADNVGRRALVGGPGIRGANGADVTDWTFIKIYEADVDKAALMENPFTLFNHPGVFAVGTTTKGQIVYAMIDQTRVNGETTVGTLTDNVVRDPSKLMRVELAPHSLWPDPNLDPVSTLPAVRDEEPLPSFPADVNDPARILSPSLRLIDAAYANDERRRIQLGDLSNLDQLGPIDEDDDEALYQESAARIAVHDYRAWVNTNWTLIWEGTLFDNPQSTGRIACDNPGWEGGTCLNVEPDDARLHDSAAQFCDRGVLPGDRLILLGCADDDHCGTGRRCLRETAGGGESTGICVSEEAYEESASDLRTICREFIQDPCGEAYREFTITKAFQDELWIQAMDRPMASTVQPAGDPVEATGEVVPPVAAVVEVEDRFVCAEGTPDGGCADDSECVDLDHDGQLTVEEAEKTGEWLCIEERCRRPCEDPDECMLRPLPGPTCFGEFVPYQIGLRNSFLVTVAGVHSALDPVDVDPDTGECVPSGSIENSTLLASRLPLPPTSDPDDPEWNAIPLCPTQSGGVLPTDPNPCRIHSTSADTLFHLLPYQATEAAQTGRYVSALRFSNPLFSLVLDLTSLEALTADVPSYGESSWPIEFADFRRSRIPRGYEQQFHLLDGYQPFARLITHESRPVTLPVRIVPSPERGVVFIVDVAGPGTTSGIRGQVIQATLADGDVLVDSGFNVK